MKTIHTITAILLAIKGFGTDKFSIHNITASVRDHLNAGDYEIEDDLNGTYITHEEVKRYFEELWNTGILSEYYDKNFNPQGYREYQLSAMFRDDLDLDDSNDVVGTPQILLTADDIKNACNASGIPFDIQKKMYSYIKNNGPVTMKQIQSRLKAPYTCEELKNFLAKINLIDTNTTFNYASHVKTIKFD